MIASVLALGRILPRTPRWVALGAVLAALQAAMLIPVGLLLRRAFDDAIPSGDVDELVLIGVLLLLLFVGSGVVALLTRRLVLRLTKDAIAALRIAVLDRLQELPLAWFDRAEVAKVHATVVLDSERVDVMANALAGQGAPATIVCGALAVALCIVDPLLFVVLGVTLPAMFLSSRRLRPLIAARTRAWQESFDRFSGRMHFALRGRPLIAAHGTEEVERREAAREIRRLSGDGMSMAWLQSLYGQINGTLAALSSVIVLVVGGAAVAEGSSTLGSLISFYALLGLLRSQSGLLLTSAPQLISGAESLRRLEAILALDVAPAYPEGGRRIEWSGRFELRDVTFSYDSRAVLEGVDLEVGAGQWVALAGPNGAGKTTIAALALGLYRPQRGEVLADGIPLSDLDLRALRSQASVVAQDPILFRGTVAENIAYGHDPVDPDAVAEAARHAGAAAVIEALPGGFETDVGDEGGLLSGGQRQLVAIARALLRRPRLLILDEPTSSLDPTVTAVVLAALHELPWQPTVLLISHDLQVLAEADRCFQVGTEIVAVTVSETDDPFAHASVER